MTSGAAFTRRGRGRFRPKSPYSEGGLGAIADLELGQDVGHVVLDGFQAQAEVFCDFGIGVAGGDAAEDLCFSGCEVV